MQRDQHADACFAGTGTSETNDSPHLLAELARKRKLSRTILNQDRTAGDAEQNSQTLHGSGWERRFLKSTSIAPVA